MTTSNNKMAVKRKKQEVAVVPEGGIVLAQSYGDDAGKGLDLDRDDIKIPLLKLIQKDSKELDPDEDTYNDQLEPGQILNTALNQAVPEDTVFVIASRRKSFVEWLPDRGGFVADHDRNAPLVSTAQRDTDGKLVLPNGNELVETKSLFLVQLDNAGNPTGGVVIPFNGSKLSTWTSYWTRIDGARVQTDNGPRRLTDVVPLWALTVRIGTKFVKNAKGKFYNYTLEPAVENDIGKSLLSNESPVYILAREFAQAVEEGRATAEVEVEDSHY